jgi:hypothetical protein
MFTRTSQLVRLAVGGLSLIGAFASTSSAFVSDGSFEAAACLPGQFVYNALGSPWTYVDGSGVAGVGSVFSAPPPPSGTKVAFLQARPSVPQTSLFFQSITLPANGSYTLSYLHAGRPAFVPGLIEGNLQYEVLLDTTVIATQSTVSGQPFTPVAIPFSANAGTYTLTFRVSPTAPLIDNTAFFDSVGCTLVPTPGAASLAGVGAMLVLRRRR